MTNRSQRSASSLLSARTTSGAEETGGTGNGEGGGCRLSDVIFHSVRSSMIARRAHRRGVLVLFKQPRFFHSEIQRKPLPLLRRRFAIAVNDLAQDAFVHSQLASQEVLPNCAAKQLQF